MTRAELLDAFHRLPRRFETLEEDERWEHRDLECLSRPELLRERAKVRDRLTHDDTPHPWFLERYRRLEETLRAR